MLGEKKDPRKIFGAAVSELAEQEERIVVLSADSGGSSGFKDFAKKHPDRYFEFGIMEQTVTGVASGMAWKNPSFLCNCTICDMPEL